MNEQPSKPWFQFSLRTVFIVLTLLAIPMGYVGWQARIARDRRAMLDQISDLYRYGGAQTGQYEHKWLYGGHSLSEKPNNISWIRRWLGDGPVDQIFLPITIPKSEIEKIQETFPEASLQIY